MMRHSGALGKPLQQTMASDELSVRAEREIVKTFRRHRAISGSSAMRLRDLGITGSPVLKAMVTRNLIRRAGTERYYLHEETLRSESAMSTAAFAKLATAIIIAGAALVIFLSTR